MTLIRGHEEVGKKYLAALEQYRTGMRRALEDAKLNERREKGRKYMGKQVAQHRQR